MSCIKKLADGLSVAAMVTVWIFLGFGFWGLLIVLLVRSCD